MIPNRWLSVSRHVGQRFRTLPVSRGSNLPRPWAQRMCCGSDDQLVGGQVPDRPDRPKPTAKGMCGSPRHKICTASLDIGPLIDGFVRRLSADQCPTPPDGPRATIPVLQNTVPRDRQDSHNWQSSCIDIQAPSHCYGATTLRLGSARAKVSPRIVNERPHCPRILNVR